MSDHHLFIDCSSGQAQYRPASEAEQAAISIGQRDAAAIRQRADAARAQLLGLIAAGDPAVRALAQLLGVLPLDDDNPGGL